MIGQDNLLNIINGFTLDTFPHTVLIEGKKGSGKHTLVKEIESNLCIDVVDLMELGITDETINDLILSPTPHLCILDISCVSIREQNVMLKFLEEPVNQCFIILLCEDLSLVLPTVLNRAQVWRLEPYTKEQLRLFYEKEIEFQEFPYTNDKIFDIADTPGDLLELVLSTDLEGVLKLIDNILLNIGNANFSNVLVLTDKIYEFNGTKGITHLEMFLKIFIYVLRERIVEKNSYYSVYSRVQKLYNDYKKSYMHFNNKYLYENFLLDLKMLMK